MKAEGMVTSKGQLVIPAELRRACRIGRGTRVRFERIKGGIAIYPKYADGIDKAYGILAGYNLPENIERDDMDREIE
jgi:AbrB family looped-hinge helix DNA binding protein